jgi:oxygen-independent coproporphyrinogen-3 oxidase
MSGIYIHIPFCLSKCIYCNFYSSTDRKLTKNFLEALTQEMQIRRDYLLNAPVKTLYFGGGTPSLLSIEELQRILENLQHHFNLTELCEITIEINPDHINVEYLTTLKSIGFNRLSIGVQSFDDRILKLLRRKHSSKEAIHTLHNAFHAGFSNVSIDLIYGIMERTNSLWIHELGQAFSFPITHLSAYALTVEENTLLYKKIQQGDLTSYSEKHVIANFYSLIQIAEKNGFMQYEISNFAKENCISLHNFSYWQSVPYLGLGPAAHSFNGYSRQWNIANLPKYIENIQQEHPVYEIEKLTDKDLFNEYVLLNLRTYRGIHLDFVKNHYGEKMQQHLTETFKNIKKSYYTCQNNHFILTNEGKLFADHIASELFTD